MRQNDTPAWVDWAEQIGLAVCLIAASGGVWLLLRWLS